ncbi:BREX-2 system adenine-specific DNA-methyltransferase PglX [Parafrankia sp. BMG5.11]|uniref:BREX-2 system adenine-specific DNA-methyltransferase PglX n=1 Tax=Parafrankia sp. BMG5.11 TaxID=222540 RepID=UPI00103C5BD2|nr:BREX-2 system adenine-specific DNA-methyltransferase PglX [Parafrankia sp. BMG5.11]TCJ33277.1 BREX-2 system adenine-specific DNA-methyltransferase PglX [Parafrankia sp. BMG5.11]
MIDRVALLKDAKQQVKVLEKDLRAQVDAVPEVGARLRAEYDRAFKVGRTAATWSAWLGERVTQAAVAWVLGTVFVRFCEDNGLIGDPYLAGPEARLTLAEERLHEFYVQQPELTARDWLLAAFGEISKVPVGAGLFDERHNALFQIPVTHDAAKDLITFWRVRQSGELVHDFTDPDWDTRFLGDLYQDLSEDVRKKYALLQTPEFVEEFILDLTLTPALEEFGYDVDGLKDFKLIDPTCGSGHFLLGAFHRVLGEWDRLVPDPQKDVFERVGLALDAVHGVDINPYAVAISRFRLIVAALRAAGLETLASAAGYTFSLHVAVGDSLLKGRQLDLFGEARDELAEFSYATEDLHEHKGILEDDKYHVVVANPPYITVKDKKINDLYRGLYNTCSGTYQLTVPFTQKFFELAKLADEHGRGAGRVGEIVGNGFVKREFGKKLIEVFFPRSTELTHVIDTSGAYIPGHGTPTVILAGRRNRSHRASTVRAVLGIRGEPAAPTNAREGLVWNAIVSQLSLPGSQSKWVSVTDRPRQEFAVYPWILGGGGTADLVEAIEDGTTKLANRISPPVGRAIRAGADEAFVRPARLVDRPGNGGEILRPLLVGEIVRDWSSCPDEAIFYPYAPGASEALPKLLWPLRHLLEERRTFQGNMADAGLSWWEYMQHTTSAYNTPSSIAFSFVATHNHFVLDRGGSVFNRSAPVIKFPAGASEEEHLRLLGVLNSSTACFWLKQVSHDKGSQGVNEGFKSQSWERFYEFTGTKLQEFPLPAEYPLELARELDGLAQRLTVVSPASVAADDAPTRARLADAQVEWASTRARMIALQEELDWQVYRQYGLLADELTLPMTDVPELKFGERAFEIVLARKTTDGDETSEWFTRHGSTPITEVPEHWPTEYRALVEKRIAVIESDRNIGLIERPEHKRRWATEGWDKLQDAALRDWLLDRLENRDLWFADVDGMVQPRLWTTGQLADELAADTNFVSVAEIYRPGEELAKVVAALVEDEHVPFLAALRYADTGLVKRADWESVWEQQRAEDAAPTPAKAKEIRDAIPVPPKYAPKDFRKTSFWRARGKLDVPKERFISYRPAGRDNDPTLLIGWAGFDHREQAQALATLIVDRRDNDGWDGTRLTPLVAGLREVMPWVRQWHDEVDPLYDGSPAEVYDAFLAETMGQLTLTEDALASWRPPAPTRGRRPTK